MIDINRKDRIPYTCGACAHYFAKFHDGLGYCRCWRVKGKEGGYVKKKHDNQACDYYVPEQASWAPMSY